jgi:hypothetical protein
VLLAVLHCDSGVNALLCGSCLLGCNAAFVLLAAALLAGGAVVTAAAADATAAAAACISLLLALLAHCGTAPQALSSAASVTLAAGMLLSGSAAGVAAAATAVATASASARAGAAWRCLRCLRLLLATAFLCCTLCSCF